MGLFSRIGASLFGPKQQAAANPADDRYYQPMSPPNAAGVKVTADSALKVAAIFRCVTILSDVLSTLPLAMYRLRQDGNLHGGMDVDPNHPISDVISLTPNLRQTPAEFWGMMGF